jgi:hypothetical protein
VAVGQFIMHNTIAIIMWRFQEQNKQTIWYGMAMNENGGNGIDIDVNKFIRVGMFWMVQKCIAWV